MSRTKSLIVALIAAGFGAAATTAFAGDTARNEDRDDYRAYNESVMREVLTSRRAPAQRVQDNFESVGGEPGWQLAQHRLVLRGGRFEHSEECDHMIRSASAAPGPREVETTKQLYPGG